MPGMSLDTALRPIDGTCGKCGGKLVIYPTGNVCLDCTPGASTFLDMHARKLDEQRVAAGLERYQSATAAPTNGRPIFGTDRLPEPERTCPAWPTLGQVEGARNAAFTRFVKGALKDKGIGAMLASGRASITYR